MELIYLASPYTAPDGPDKNTVEESRYQSALRVTKILLERGQIVFSPIVHNHVLSVQYGLKGDFSFWSAYCKEMIRRCDVFAVLVTEGWVSSVGISLELMYAKVIGKPTIYLDMAGNDIVLNERCEVVLRQGVADEPTTVRVDADGGVVPCSETNGSAPSAPPTGGGQRVLTSEDIALRKHLRKGGVVVVPSSDGRSSRRFALDTGCNMYPTERECNDAIREAKSLLGGKALMEDLSPTSLDPGTRDHAQQMVGSLATLAAMVPGAAIVIHEIRRFILQMIEPKEA